MRKLTLITLFAIGMLMVLPSCLKSDADDYEAWRERNDAFIDQISLDEYDKITPPWAPMHSVYIKWHNDRSLTANNLMPISTSTVSVKYELENIDGDTLQTSYKANGDSLYTSVVNNNIVGFQIGLTYMHVGDSVTMIIPYHSGYGAQVTSSMKPYTDLIYRVKLVSIPAYEKEDN